MSLSFPRMLVPALLLASAASFAQAPQSSAAAPPPDPLSPVIRSLGQNAASRTDFTLDHSMLVFASKWIDRDDLDVQRVIAGLNAISVHAYQFRQPGMFDPAALETVRRQYHAAGWKHMVSEHKRRDVDGGKLGVSDLWLQFQGANITNVAVLLEGPRQLDFLGVSGTLRPLDLMHLSGHFGIPNFDNDHMVPAP
jgi:hypothetical protein